MNKIEIKVARTLYIIEAKNAEKSKGSADFAFKKIVADSVSQM